MALLGFALIYCSRENALRLKPFNVSIPSNFQERSNHFLVGAVVGVAEMNGCRTVRPISPKGAA